MNLIKSCTCGAVLSEANFKPPVGKAKLFGLPEGTMGNTNMNFVKVKCPDCGNEYIAETKPGKYGGTIAIGRIIDNGLNETPIAAKPTEQVKPAKPEKPNDTARIEGGYIIIPEA